MNGITINGESLHTYLEEEKVKDMIHTINAEAKKPLYKKQYNRMPQDTVKNGPVIMYSKGEIMKDNLRLEIERSDTVYEKIVGVLLLGEEVTAEEILNTLKNKTTILTVKFYLRKLSATLFWDHMRTIKNDGIKSYQYIGTIISLKEAMKLARVKYSDKEVPETLQVTSNSEETSQSITSELVVSSSVGIDELIKTCIESGRSFSITISMEKK